MPNNITVSITADVADLTAKRAIMSAELAAASKDLRGFAEAARASGGTGQLSAGMLAAAESVAQTKAQIAAATAELKGMSAQGAATGATVSASLKEMRDTGAEVRANFRGIGEALIAAFAVHEVADAAKSMADTAEQTQHAAETFGLTTDQVQRLKAEAAGLGVPFEAFTTAMQREDGALTRAREGTKQAIEAFKMLGINIHEPIDQATLLQRSIAGLATIQDVPTRIGIAMQLFGRNVQNLGPIIGATKAQIDAVAASTDRYGAVNGDAQAKGLELANAFNQQKIEMMGLGLTLTSELAPTLTKLVTDITGMLESFRQWASQGNNLKDALAALTIAATGLAAVLGAGALTAAVEGLAGLLGGPLMIALAVATGGMFKFDAAADANPIGAVVLAVEALVAGLYFLTDGFNKTNAVTVAVVDGFKALVDEVGQMLRTLGDLVGGLMDVGKAIQAVNRGDLSGIQKALEDLTARWRDADAASKQYEADASGVATALDEEAAAAARAGAALAALGAQMQGDQGTGTPDRPVGLPPGGGGGHKGHGGKGRSPKSAGGGDEVGQQMQAWTDQWQQTADMAAVISGNANLDLLQAEINFWAQKLSLAKQGSAEWFAVLEKLNPLVAQQQQEQTSELKRQTDEQVATIVKGVNAEVAAQKKGYDEAVRASEKAAEASQRAWDKSIGAITKDFAQGLLKMAQGTQSLQQTMLQIVGKIETAWVDNIAKMVSRWMMGIAQQVAGNAAGQAAIVAAKQAGATQSVAIDGLSQMKEIVNAAATAAAKAYQALAGIPVIGPMLGAGAAAATFAAVMAFKGMIASAAGGYDIPAGVSPLTQLHAQEMVLPASIAQPLKASLATGGPWGGGDGGGFGAGHSFSFGDTHINGTNLGASEVRQLLSDHRHDLAKQVYQAVREGSRAPRGLGSPFTA